MGRGGGRSGGGGFSSGGSRGFSSHRSSSSHRGGSSVGRSGGSSIGRSSLNNSSLFTGTKKTSKPKSYVPPKQTVIVTPTVITQNNQKPPRTQHYDDRSISETYKTRNSSYSSGPSYQNERENSYRDTGNYRSTSTRKPKNGIPDWYKWLCGFTGFIIVILLVYASIAMNTAKNAKTREKLPPEACIEMSQVMEDELGWITDKRTVEEGIDYFYQKTGIQPYLIVCDNLEGIGGEITDSQAEAALERRYDDLFRDEGHMLYVFMEYEESEYITYLYSGTAANSIMDNDAREVFLNTADRLYTNSSLSDEQFFAKTFHNSADSIMKDASGSAAAARACLIVSVIAAIMLVGGFIFFKSMEEKRKKAEEVKAILNTPIHDTGYTPEESELMKKYSPKND